MLRKIERFCELVEVVAGVLLGVVMVLTVASTAGRYLFAWPVPDAFDLSRLLIGACIMWGLASVGYRGGHIAVDLLYEIVGKRSRQMINVAAWLALLSFTVMLTVMLYHRVASAYASHEVTFDLKLPVWPLLLLIWIGCAVSVVTVALALFRRSDEDVRSNIEGHTL
jgi:C4-dicarboxylate transporter, DctQ subunit